MKKFTVILIALFAISLNSVAQESVIRLSDPVWETEEFELFGDINDQKKLDTTITLKEALSAPVDTLIASFRVPVAEVCAKKGCFFVAVDGDYEARITFKDYGFFIPTDAAGKEVVLYGMLTKKILSEEQAKHYAEDAGSDPNNIEGEQAEYSILASSVLVPKSN